MIRRVVERLEHDPATNTVTFYFHLDPTQTEVSCDNLRLHSCGVGRGT